MPPILARTSSMSPSSMKALFPTLYRVVQGLIEQLSAEGKSYQQISLSGPGNGLFVRILGSTCQLRCNLGEASSMDLSLDEARALFTSIASACETQEVVKIRIRRLTWTTDARPNPRDTDKLTVTFSGALGLGHIGLSRHDMISACEQFFNIRV